MRRDQLEHLLRAASTITDDPNVIVFGSQAILGSFAEQLLPPEATYSVESDFTFFNDENDDKSDHVDGAIGELSMFHETFGIYAQGVSITTAVLPLGWQDRVVVIEAGTTEPARGHCLEPHDLVISKLVANRDKDREFAAALLNAGLVSKDTLLERAAQLVDRDHDTERIVAWLRQQQAVH